MPDPEPDLAQGLVRIGWPEASITLGRWFLAQQTAWRDSRGRHGELRVSDGLMFKTYPLCVSLKSSPKL